MKKIIGLLVFLALAACSESEPPMTLPTLTSLSATTPSASVEDTPASTSDFESEEVFDVGSTIVSEKDEAVLVYVPEGEFLMGSDESRTSQDGEQSPSYYDNHPQRSIFLDAFWIDKFEVTNRQFTKCVSDGGCILPENLKSVTRSNYFGDPKFDDFPVIYVNWYMAKAYCEWAGRRLPTEAEWEKAARGEKGNMYPWGNEIPNDALLNFDSPNKDTNKVGQYPNGASPYGALDMAGNVWEWVNDWYHFSYYQFAPDVNPPGPDSSDDRTSPVKSLRGGSWYFQEESLRSIFRYGVIPVNDLVRSDLRSWLVPDYSDTNKYGKPPHGLGTVGFRCVASVIP